MKSHLVNISKAADRLKVIQYIFNYNQEECWENPSIYHVPLWGTKCA